MSSGDLLLADRHRRVFGTVVIDRSEGDLRVGRFIPGDWPAELQELFEQYEVLINDQVLSALDKIEEEIAAHGFCLSSPGTGTCDAIVDVQITHDHRISFRMTSTH